MLSFDSLSNNIGGLPAQTVQTGTHTLFSFLPTLGDSETAGVPAEFFVGYPALLSTGRGDPHSGSSFSVDDRKSPFGFKLQNFGVANDLGSKRVNNFDRFDAKNHLGLDPDSVNNNSQDETKYNFENRLQCVSTNKNTICTKKNNKYIGTTGPNKVTSRSKSFIHSLSIAGETK